MSSFILQLLVISAFGLMIQCAPVNDVTKRSTDKKENEKKLEKRLYCTAESLYHAQEDLEKVNFNLPSLPQDDIDKTTKAIANKIFDHFSDQCKHFTKVMTFKHLLQEHLFSNDSTSSVLLESDNAKTLSIILTNLQSLAKIFNDLELNENNSRCVKLTPAQYRIMYYVRYTTPLLKSWKNDITDWYRSDVLYKHGKHCK